jgi:hypothetical protein
MQTDVGFNGASCENQHGNASLKDLWHLGHNTARPDIVRTNQPQPVDALGIGQVCRGWRLGVHASPTGEHGSTCGRGEGGLNVTGSVNHRDSGCVVLARSQPDP